jgi:hypothetical protein
MDLAAHRAALERICAELDRAYDTARGELLADIASGRLGYPGSTPEQIRDASGRYILLDALVAAANAHAALASLA